MGNLLNWHGGELLLHLGCVVYKLLLLSRSSILYLRLGRLACGMVVYIHDVGFHTWCMFTYMVLVFIHGGFHTWCMFSYIMLVFIHDVGLTRRDMSSSSIIIRWLNDPVKARSWQGFLEWTLHLSLSTILHEIGTFTYQI